MTTDRLDVPKDEDLRGLSVVVQVGDEAWKRCVSAFGGDGSEVSVIWDEFARTVDVTWVKDGCKVLDLCRDGGVRVAVSQQAHDVVFRAWFDYSQVVSTLEIRVGSDVKIVDQQRFTN